MRAINRGLTLRTRQKRVLSVCSTELFFVESKGPLYRYETSSKLRIHIEIVLENTFLEERRSESLLACDTRQRIVCDRLDGSLRRFLGCDGKGSSSRQNRVRIIDIRLNFEGAKGVDG